MGCCSSKSARRRSSVNTFEERLLSIDGQWLGGESVNHQDRTDYLQGLNHFTRKEKVATDFRAKTNIILDRSSMWDYLDVPLDVPFTEEDVQKYRWEQRSKADHALRECQRKIFDKEFLAMTKQFPNVVLGQICLPETIKPFQFLLKVAREFTSLCLTAKEPLSRGYFNQMPMDINEKILTYLTGVGDLHTRVLWISMRSELNKYDRSYIKDASTARAEASFLDRVAMNLFEQLNNRVKQGQINVEDDVNFEEWRENFVESGRLKIELRLAKK